MTNFLWAKLGKKKNYFANRPAFADEIKEYCVSVVCHRFCDVLHQHDEAHQHLEG